MIAALVLLAIVVLLVLWVIGAYNGLIGLKNKVANAWKQIDVQLKRRHDLIPNLVNTVKGAMDFERNDARGGHLRAEQGGERDRRGARRRRRRAS